ncbi:MAG: hypothetical protein CVV27_08980 [Candidatus Melainabacteria bacterium HGW-Melainabacteria-1]|nr:MAG: hypothetical protein CVV27_08980 [Candidatus Melainabacteria bacterium HGW-Melainabacteria-1]
MLIYGDVRMIYVIDLFSVYLCFERDKRSRDIKWVMELIRLSHKSECYSDHDIIPPIIPAFGKNEKSGWPQFRKA